MHVLPLGDVIQQPANMQDHQVEAPLILHIRALQQDTIVLTPIRYGHYTLVVCVIGTIVIVAFGHSTLAEHAHFIPVYAMGSSFVTAAWPSLEESWIRVRSDGYQPLPRYIQETSEYPAARNILLDRYRVESEGQAALRASMTSWLRDQSRHRGSPPSSSPPPSLVEYESRPEQQSMAAWVHDIQYMGPGSHRSQGRSNSGTSISLSSRPAVPSEISTNVQELLGQDGSARLPRSTQRRRDIDSLGQIITPREEVSSSV